MGLGDFRRLHAAHGRFFNLSLVSEPFEECLKPTEPVISGGRFPFRKKVRKKSLDMLPMDVGHFEGHSLVS